MRLKVAINGYGRIGRNLLRAIYESKYNDRIQVMVINTKGDASENAHLTKYDSVQGKFSLDVIVSSPTTFIIAGDKITLINERDPLKIYWDKLGVDVVLECTGSFNSLDLASLHLKGGAKKVLLSGPAGNDVKTIVYGVNHQTLQDSDKVVSAASCTTNCLAPLAAILDDNFGIVSGLMTTIHSYTNDQVLTDVYHSDLRRARSATQSMIPTKTGAAAAIGLIIPALQGKLDGFALRVPTINVSLVDLSFIAKKEVTVNAINTALQEASLNKFKNLVVINTEPLVSIDFNHNSASCIFDATQTRVNENLVKVLAWYDNEWGFVHRMIDLALLMQS